MESEETKVRLFEKEGDIKLILERGTLVQMIVLTEQDACNMYFWVNGVKESNLITPIEFTINEIEYWWDYETWKPVWDVLHPWYENYLDNMTDEPLDE